VEIQEEAEQKKQDMRPPKGMKGEPGQINGGEGNTVRVGATSDFTAKRPKGGRSTREGVFSGWGEGKKQESGL